MVFTWSKVESKNSIYSRLALVWFGQPTEAERWFILGAKVLQQVITCIFLCLICFHLCQLSLVLIQVHQLLDYVKMHGIDIGLYLCINKDYWLVGLASSSAQRVEVANRRVVYCMFYETLKYSEIIEYFYLWQNSCIEPTLKSAFLY